jgi:hypothetical protein
MQSTGGELSLLTHSPKEVIGKDVNRISYPLFEEDHAQDNLLYSKLDFGGCDLEE